MPLQPDSSAISLGQLENVWLRSIHFDTHDFDTQDASRVTYGVSYEVAVAPPEDDGGGWYSTATMWARIDWERTDDYDGPTPFDLELTLGSVFGWEADPGEPRDAISWVEFNAPHLLWPYLRNYVATITGLGAAPRLMIYTISVQYPALPDEDDLELEDVSDDSLRDERPFG